ncbi:valine--tRNA ligase [soil metagenome]
MDSKFIPAQHEENLYRFWEQKGYFEGHVNKSKEPFCIILPPPNANANLHLGHALMVNEDIMIRYQKLQGREVLWVSGADHAGIETQFVYEKHLKKQNKSRFDFDRETLFKDIWAFVMENRDTMENQLRRLGFGLDWSKKKFTMDEDIVATVYKTFKDFHDKKLVYRANRLVNYCTSCGTSFSDLEVNDKEVEGNLYHIKFPVKDGGEIIIATTRPETYLGDVAVMVHPKDKRYKGLIGKTVVLPIINREIPIIADEYVDMKFGTGAVKVTPNHDFNDFEIAKKHNLTYPPIIGFDGKMQNTGLIDGLRVKAARVEILKQLQEGGFIDNITPHHMVQKVCYRCSTVLEPLPKEQWFINVRPLADKAIKLVQDDTIQVHPKQFKKQLVRILENFIDWNISRQIVWGIRIPAYRCINKSEWFVSLETPKKCEICSDCAFVQDEDTFDTWFSSAQWPFATLQAAGQEYFDYFYPTSVMETGYDILRAWVARMIMVGYFETEKVPFEHIFLHGMVRDKHGQKMSKSKGNVINPIEMIDKYGADALRAALIFGTKEGGDVVLSEQKILGMRNFANKIWNIGRFISMNKEPRTDEQKTVISAQNKEPSVKKIDSKVILNELQKEFSGIEKKYHGYFKKFLFAKAFDLMYEFVWHRLADHYIEVLKEELRDGNMEVYKNLEEVYSESIKLLHPYMPFVTEAVWKQFYGQEQSVFEERHL